MMKREASWQFNEFRPPGRDYGREQEVAIYDETHSDFRDLEGEAVAALNLIGLREGDALLDVGCGTGVFAVSAALRCALVHAADVSEAMLEATQQRARAAGRSNIHFHHAGFLSLDLPDHSIDVVASTFAFHHLPDFWKGIALANMARILKPGGKLYLRDVILESEGALEHIQAFIDTQAQLGGDFLREDAEGHFRDEYSTYDWVMESLLARSGFTICHRHYEGGVIGTYLAIRN